MTLPRTRQVSLSRFRGQIIAVDALLWAYANISIALKTSIEAMSPLDYQIDRDDVIRRWVSAALDNAIMYMNHAITPVYIFDGVHIEDKAKTQATRTKDRMSIRDEIAGIQTRLDGQSPLDRSTDDINRLRTLMCRDTYIRREELTYLQDALSSAGIPVLQAVGEAEQLCSSLAQQGLISAVVSRDTDPLVWECPVVIVDLLGYTAETIDGEVRQARQVSLVVLQDILTSLNWDQATFVDFCITLGCDFNQRVPGLGPKTAYKLIQEHGRVDAFPAKYDTTCLRLDRCRTIFASSSPRHVVEGESIVVTTPDLQLDRTSLGGYGAEYLSELGLGDFVPRLKYALVRVPVQCQGQILTWPERRIIRLPKRSSVVESI